MTYWNNTNVYEKKTIYEKAKVDEITCICEKSVFLLHLMLITYIGTIASLWLLSRRNPTIHVSRRVDHRQQVISMIYFWQINCLYGYLNKEVGTVDRKQWNFLNVGSLNRSSENMSFIFMIFGQLFCLMSLGSIFIAVVLRNTN